MKGATGANASRQRHTLHLSKGQTIMAAFADAGICLRTDCGGTGKCGQCRVQPAPEADLSPPAEAELFHLTTSRLQNGDRLACQAQSLRFQTIPIDIPEETGSFASCTLYQDIDPKTTRAVGVAIDLGTTCIDLYLCDLADGSLLVSVKGGNRQRCHGHDVVARITAAGDPDIGLSRLQQLAVDTINHLLANALAAGGIKKNAIQKVTVAGNTTMTLIFTGIDPQPLGRYPYCPPVTTFPPYTAGQFDLALAPDTPVQLFPVVSGFIGGDTVSALFARKPFDVRHTTLLVDIGTNGELVLCRYGKIMAASCATGPAFEGATISCGMPAVTGAIDHLTIDPQSGSIDWHVIGSGAGALPAGICGSGIVDAVAGLVAAGAVTPGGLLNTASPLVSLSDACIAEAILVPAHKTRHGRALSLSQKDIGEVQLAKAAICAGIQLLLLRTGTTRIDHTLLTGAFGAGFDSRKALAIGMLPLVPGNGRVSVASDLAGKGARKGLLFSEDLEAKARSIARRIEVLELGGDPLFEKWFVDAMAFPVALAKGAGTQRS